MGEWAERVQQHIESAAWPEPITFASFRLHIKSALANALEIEATSVNVRMVLDQVEISIPSRLHYLSEVDQIMVLLTEVAKRVPRPHPGQLSEPDYVRQLRAIRGA